jgi:hypothetical protein
VSFFSAIGKIFKSIPVVGNVLGVAEGVVEAGASLLSHKQPMTKPIAILPRIQGTSTASILSASPVMPGGGISTPAGIMAAGFGRPPVAYSSTGMRRPTHRRKKKSTTHRASSKRKSGGMVTYKGRRYTAKQARIFVPSHRR